MSIVLDGLEGSTEVNGVTITDCAAIAYATYKQTEVLQTQNLSNLVSDSLLFMMSYSKFLREKLGEEDESLKVVTKVFEQVRLCERHNQKVVADERGAFILKILEIYRKELKYCKELKNAMKTNLTLHSP